MLCGSRCRDRDLGQASSIWKRCACSEDRTDRTWEVGVLGFGEPDGWWCHRSGQDIQEEEWVLRARARECCVAWKERRKARPSAPETAGGGAADSDQGGRGWETPQYWLGVAAVCEPGRACPAPSPGRALVTMPFSMSHFQAMVTGCGSSVQPKRHNRGESQASRLTFWVGRFPPFLSLVIAVCVILLPSRCPPTREDNLRERR